eukprot:15485583-Alexandrium_andersonii.AAC.1
MPIAALGQRREPGRPRAAKARRLAEHLMALGKAPRGTELYALLLQAPAPEGTHVEVDVVIRALGHFRPAPGSRRARVLTRQMPLPRHTNCEGEDHGAEKTDVALPGGWILR